MTDFGRRPGDMFKSDYDANLDGIVDALLAHKLLHQLGGTDVISVAGLAGELAAAQPSTWAKVASKPTTFAPAAHKASHQTGDGDAIDCTGLVGRINYVDRGDPDGWDKEVGDFITDFTWRDLDLSTPVPAGASAIHIKVNFTHSAASHPFYLRKKDITYTLNASIVTNHVANLPANGEHIISCGSTRVIQYRGSDTTFTTLNLVVRGWFI